MTQQMKIFDFYPLLKGKSDNVSDREEVLKTARISNKSKSPVKHSKSGIRIESSNSVSNKNKRKSRKNQQSKETPEKYIKHESPSGNIVKIYPSQDSLSRSTEKNQPFESSSDLSQSPDRPRSSQHDSPGSQRSGSFTPKQSPRFSSCSPGKGSYLRKLFEDDNSESIRKVVENLNLVKEGALKLNDFDLSKIYTNKQWSFNYNTIKTDSVEKLEVREVILPREKHADQLISIIIQVFLDIINCGYFDEGEIDFLFSILTSSAKSQMLFVRLLKRKKTWHRVSAIQYPEIADDLNVYFEELKEKGYCESNIITEDVTSLLRILQLDDIRKLCQKLKVDHRGNKTKMIEKLMQLNSKKRSWFVGAKSPELALRSHIAEVIGPCYRLSNRANSLFDRIFLLLVPCQDPSESISDLFHMLSRVKSGEILFPAMPKERFPIFRNREHLLGYVEARNHLKTLLDGIENKDWETVRNIGEMAYMRLFLHVEDNDRGEGIPSHVKKFLPHNIWVKILSKSIDSYKKTPNTIELAVKFLRALINQKNYGRGYLGRWYKELSLIEMHHRKDLRTSAELTLEALSLENLSDVDLMDLCDRANKLTRRKTGISDEMKSTIRIVVDNLQRTLPAEFDIINEIEANLMEGNAMGTKSTWTFDYGENKVFARVEQIALRHYQEEYPRGLHCEGSLPLTFFTVFFWNELYSIPVPGAFVSTYQISPLDLYTSNFFENRKEQILSRIRYMRSLDEESFAELMSQEFVKYQNFQSTINSNLFEDDQHFKEGVRCMGSNGVIGICERLATNFNLWKSGFPDLFVWNPLKYEAKIVEVKGPGDSLSTKQKLWLQYLKSIGVAAEVCLVRAAGKYRN